MFLVPLWPIQCGATLSLLSYKICCLLFAYCCILFCIVHICQCHMHKTQNIRQIICTNYAKMMQNKWLQTVCICFAYLLHVFANLFIKMNRLFTHSCRFWQPPMYICNECAKKCSNKHLHVKWTFCGPETLRKLPQNRILLYFHISSQRRLVWGWHGPDYLQ